MKPYLKIKIAATLCNFTIPCVLRNLQPLGGSRVVVLLRNYPTRLIRIFKPNYYRPQTKLGQGNIFRSMCKSFCRRGAARGRAGWHAWQGGVACVAGGCVWLGGMCGGGVHGREERRPQKRAVRILLECILVLFLSFHYRPQTKFPSGWYRCY